MKKLLMLTGLGMLMLPVVSFAESHEERKPLTSVWFMVPKADMAGQFEAAFKEYAAWRTAAGDSRTWSMYSPAIGHNLGVYQLRTCCYDWADQDAYNAEAEEKGFGAKWNADVAQYVDHYHRYFEYNDWENSHWPDDESTDGPYFGVTSWTWKMGVGNGPNEARKELSQMALREGWGEAGNNWLWLSRVGGRPTIMVVTPFSDYADMQPPEQSFFEFISEKMGSEEAAEELFTTFGSGLASSDFTVWRHRGDLIPRSD